MFSIREVQTLLDANSQGHIWDAPFVVAGEKVWRREGGGTARLNSDGTKLQIKSRDLAVEQAAAKQAEKSPSLEGF